MVVAYPLMTMFLLSANGDAREYRTSSLKSANIKARSLVGNSLFVIRCQYRQLYPVLHSQFVEYPPASSKNCREIVSDADRPQALTIVPVR
jgi:hypothetical protein